LRLPLARPLGGEFTAFNTVPHDFVATGRLASASLATLVKRFLGSAASRGTSHLK
jgi:hypothetical protein